MLKTQLRAEKSMTGEKKYFGEAIVAGYHYIYYIDYTSNKWQEPDNVAIFDLSKNVKLEGEAEKSILKEIIKGF